MSQLRPSVFALIRLPLGGDASFEVLLDRARWISLQELPARCAMLATGIFSSSYRKAVST